MQVAHIVYSCWTEIWSLDHTCLKDSFQHLNPRSIDQGKQILRGSDGPAEVTVTNFDSTII
jgi:hypothetical protein